MFYNASYFEKLEMNINNLNQKKLLKPQDLRLI